MAADMFNMLMNGGASADYSPPKSQKRPWYGVAESAQATPRYISKILYGRYQIDQLFSTYTGRAVLRDQYVIVDHNKLAYGDKLGGIVGSKSSGTLIFNSIDEAMEKVAELAMTEN